MMRKTIVALAALAGLAGSWAPGASAFPTNDSPALGTGASPSLMIEVESRYERDALVTERSGSVAYDRAYHGARCDSWSDNCRYRHGSYYYETPWWVTPVVGAGIAIGAASAAVTGYPEIGYSTRHVRWCGDRYRSYNARTNTWVSNSGRVRQCESPYGP